MRALLLIAIVFALEGCAAVPDILRVVGAGASWLSSALDVADAGQQAYFARHPMPPERAYAVRDALLQAREALAALEGTRSALESGQDGDLEAAKREAVEAYQHLHKLLEATGVLDGKCLDCGGVETEAPEPKPLVLPPPHVVAARMEV